MRWTVCSVFLLAIGFAVPSPALASSVEEFDVIGMRLGMSVAEIEKAAADHALTEDHRQTAPSFEQKVAKSRGERIRSKDYAAIRSLRFVSDVDEVIVKFVATADGERAFRIMHMLLDTTVKADDLVAQMEATYGAPDAKHGDDWLWGDTHRDAVRRSAPFLEFSLRPQTRSKSMRKPVGLITLEDSTLPKETKAAVKAEL